MDKLLAHKLEIDCELASVTELIDKLLKVTIEALRRSQLSTAAYHCLSFSRIPCWCKRKYTT